MIPGDTVGPYVVLDRLGAGGMGEVYRAHDDRLNRTVALKRLSDPALAGDVAHRRMLREARAAAALSHPNIATIYDVLDTADGLVIVMEHVPGETLNAKLRAGPLSVPQAVGFAGQITDALAAAHDAGIVHRDLKPANIIITPDGKPKILDFGIARSRSVAAAPDGPDATLTEAGHIVGTPSYMAPEQLAGGPVDHRTDIYGVGLLLYEMAAGRRPFDRTDAVAHAMAVFDNRVPRLAEVAPHVPAEFSDLVAHAMARQPEGRFQSARELGAALDRFARHLGESVTHTSYGSGNYRRIRDRLRRRPALVATVLVMVCAALAALAWTSPWGPPSAATPPMAIGVVPFTNQSANPADDALAIGLSEAVAARLASVRSLRVLPVDETREAARTASDPTKTASSLGASFVVLGALERQGNELAVDVSLLASDGSRRSVGRFAGTAGDQFELHRRVTEAVTGALKREGAAEATTAAVTAPPTANPEAFAEFAQGRTFLERPDIPGNLDHAVRLFQSAIAKDPRFALAHAALGEAYWSQYRETNDTTWTTKATTAILDALRLDAAQPEVRMSLAVMYQGLGRRDDAVEELRQVIALQPQNDHAHRVWAAIHADQGNWDAAVAAARHAIELRPQYWRNHAELGDTLLRAGRLTEASGAYRRLIELQPDSARGYQRLGLALQTSGEVEEALSSYLKATAIRPSFGAYSNMGTLYYWRGDYTKAVDAYEKAIALAPHQPEVHGNLGDALQRLGRSREAEASYQRALEGVRRLLAVKSNDPSNLAALGLYQAKLGQRAAAAASIAKAEAASPDDGDVLYVSALVHALAGERDAACTALTAALAKGASAEVVRRADELRPLRGCAAYKGVVSGR
jgi:serine/threonine-protein kinase